MPPNYARAVPGSAQLKTRRNGSDPVLQELQELAAGQLESRHHGPRVLGKAVVRSGFVPVLVEIFDQLCAQLHANEAMLYLQLYRHSYGEERNYCQKSRRELCDACNFSERRFNRALAGLVSQHLVELIHRDKGGTYYLVHVPKQKNATELRERIFFGRVPRQPHAAQPELPRPLSSIKTSSQSAPKVPIAQAEQARRAATIVETVPEAHEDPGLAPMAVADRLHKMQPVEPCASLGAIVEMLLAKTSSRRKQAIALDVLQDLTSLLEDGMSLAELLHLAQRFTRDKRAKAEQFFEFVRSINATLD